MEKPEAKEALKEVKSRAMAGNDQDEFYLRYYVGHKGKFGHEFLEFEFRPDGKLRYANNSNYKNDTMIRKEVFLTPAVLRECRRIISESEVFFPSQLLSFLRFWFVRRRLRISCFKLGLLTLFRIVYVTCLGRSLICIVPRWLCFDES